MTVMHASSRLFPIPLVALLALSSCAFNPATGEHQLAFISEQQEIAMGMEADKQVAGSMGLVQNDALQRYVNEVGQSMAAKSERPDLPWKFKVVDDPVVNAFALPGGFIYLTRGILAHFNSEAEMASVLGHEIGHVTARHSVEQMSRQQLAGIGLGVAMAVAPELQPFGQLAQTGLGLMFLKYGRDDERQADDLGLRYMGREGYDPSQMPLVFDTLARVSQAQGDGRVPAWMSTHPAPDERAERVRAALAQAIAESSELRVRRDAYLEKIDGLVFGEDPRQGYFKDGTFFHPELAFSVEFPNGWQTANQQSQVIGVSPQKDAMVVLSMAKADDAATAARGFFSQKGLRAGTPRSAKINGLTTSSAPFQAATEQGTVAGVATFIDHNKKVYQLLAYTGTKTLSAYASAFDGTMRSFRRVRDSAVLNVKPGHIDVVKLRRAMTLREFMSSHRTSADIETLSLINQLEPDQQVPAGTRVKRIVGGELPK